MDFYTLFAVLALGSFALIAYDGLISPMGGGDAAKRAQVLEIAYLGLLIGGLAWVTKFTSFAMVLFLATFITGILWAVGAIFMRHARPAAAGAPAVQEAAPGGFEILVEIARGFFPVILIVFLIRSFLVEPFKIPSGSMLPTLFVGDFILVNKYAYGIRLPVLDKKIIEIGNPQRGDVMVFHFPLETDKDYIKRVVGVPGDVVEYRNKRLTVNGNDMAQTADGSFTSTELIRYQQMREKLGDVDHTIIVNPNQPDYIPSSVSNFPFREGCEYRPSGFRCTVPKGHYFMLGDNRDGSLDSRYWGFVPDDHIVGKAFFIWMNFGDLKRIGTSIR